MTRIGFIGSGNMASALIKGILDGGICDSSSIITSDVNSEKLAKLGKELGIYTTTDNDEVAAKSDVIFIAVKPQDVDSVLRGMKGTTGGKIFVSIAAGITVKRIESVLGDAKIVRVMPNTPCLVGEMAAGFSPNGKLTVDDKALVKRILESSGKAYMLGEDMLDAVTGLSGSGPAFVSWLIGAFAKAGSDNGLPEDVAYGLALKTFGGTAKLLSEKNMMPEDLISMVSSPNGTTVAGMKILGDSDVARTIGETVKKAAERSRELGGN